MITKSISTWLPKSMLIEINSSQLISQFVPDKSKRKSFANIINCIYNS